MLACCFELFFRLGGECLLLASQALVVDQAPGRPSQYREGPINLWLEISLGYDDSDPNAPLARKQGQGVSGRSGEPFGERCGDLLLLLLHCLRRNDHERVQGGCGLARLVGRPKASRSAEACP